MGVRGKVRLTPPETPFHADFNELLCVSMALTLTKIMLDCDHTRTSTHVDLGVSYP